MMIFFIVLFLIDGQVVVYYQGCVGYLVVGIGKYEDSGVGDIFGFVEVQWIIVVFGVYGIYDLGCSFQQWCFYQCW